MFTTQPQLQCATLIEIHKTGFDAHTPIIGHALLAVSRAEAKVLMMTHACAEGHFQFCVRSSDSLRVMSELRDQFADSPKLTYFAREVTLVRDNDPVRLQKHLTRVDVEVVATAKDPASDQYIIAEVWNKNAPSDV